MARPTESNGRATIDRRRRRLLVRLRAGVHASGIPNRAQRADRLSTRRITLLPRVRTTARVGQRRTRSDVDIVEEHSRPLSRGRPERRRHQRRGDDADSGNTRSSPRARSERRRRDRGSPATSSNEPPSATATSINLEPCKPDHRRLERFSGMHANFSDTTCSGPAANSRKRTISDLRRRSRLVVKRTTSTVYGADNDQRLTGLPTRPSRSIKFSYGVSDRGASIRIPIGTVENGWKGWLEDRRPASNADPYMVASAIIITVKSAKVPANA